MSENQQLPGIVRFREITENDYTRSQFAKLLGDETRIDRFMRILTSTVGRNDDLLGCDMGSIVSCAMQGAQLNLDPEPSLGQFYLVPRKGVCTFVVGYQGMIQLALRSGRVRSVKGRVVYRQDEFDFAEGTNGFIKHVPNVDLAEAPHFDDDFRAAYAVAKFVRRAGEPDDFEFVVMPRWQVNRVRDVASKATNDKSPWKVWPDAMRAKTAVRQLFKFLQVSAEMVTAITLDEQADADLTQSLTVSYQRPSSAKGLASLTGKLAGEQAPAAPAAPPAAVAPAAPAAGDPPGYVPMGAAEVPEGEQPADASGGEQADAPEQWSDDEEKKAAQDALRVRVRGVLGESPTDPAMKRKLAAATVRAFTDALGIFGREKIEEVEKAEWPDFCELLLSNVAGIGSKIGEGGESELRRKIITKVKSMDKAVDVVKVMVSMLGVETLADIKILDLPEAEAYIEGIKG